MLDKCTTKSWETSLYEPQQLYYNLMGEKILTDKNVKSAYYMAKHKQSCDSPAWDGMTRTILIDGMEQDQAWSLIRYHILHGPSDCVKRFDIPKSNGKTRPISIYPLLDRVAQWCIMGPLSKACGPLLSPINHAFQKGKSCKTAFEAFPPAGEAGYVICGDIHSFFDTVSHSLVRACLWSAGIRDSQLLHTINVTLKTPYKYPKQPKVRPEQGLPQGAPISPLLANIILAYMDRYFVSLYGDQKLPRMVRY